jgi:hypothetical protein
VILAVINLTACSTKSTTAIPDSKEEPKQTVAQAPVGVRTTDARTIKGDYAHSNLFVNLPDIDQGNVKAEILSRLKRHPKKVDLSMIQLTVGKVTKDDLSPFKSPEAINSVNKLSIGKLGITDEALESLSGLRLQDLTLTGDPVRNLHAIKNTQSLSLLNVSETPIDHQGMKVIGNLSNLKVLRFNKTKISDADLPYLYGLTKLQQLSLMDCPNVSAPAVDKLRQKLPNCFMGWQESPKHSNL